VQAASYERVASTGPKTSSRAIMIALSTPAKTVGRHSNRGRGPRSAIRFGMYDRTRSGCAADARGRSARRPRVDRRARACGVSTCLDTALSGAHRGPEGIAALRRQIDELTAGTWRPLRDDSFDIAMSPWHGVIMDRFLAERRERRLDSHEAVILAVEQAASRGSSITSTTPLLCGRRLSRSR
jgi:hypothetical protein